MWGETLELFRGPRAGPGLRDQSTVTELLSGGPKFLVLLLGTPGSLSHLKFETAA